ncbi:MAG: hypothetical protein JRC90_11995 [Deltaproteobacteria bacterium]|nr:hypothetical protein [Deltaproteobacteria bacterium]
MDKLTEFMEVYRINQAQAAKMLAVPASSVSKWMHDDLPQYITRMIELYLHMTASQKTYMKKRLLNP